MTEFYMDVFLVVDTIDIFKEFSWNEEQGLNFFIVDIFNNSDFGINLVSLQLAYKAQIGFFCSMKSIDEVREIIQSFDVDKFKIDIFNKFETYKNTNTNEFNLDELESEYDLTENKLNDFLEKIINRIKNKFFVFVTGEY